MRKKRWIAAIGLLAAMSMVGAACGDDGDDTAGDGGGGNGDGGDKLKAAWIYVGPTNDGGWTTAHDNGRKAVEEALGDKVETTYKENVPEGPETAQVIEDLIKDGNTIIFSTSFGFSDAVKAAAEAHPDVHFEQATGAETAENLATYYGAGEDSLFLAGMAAGAATENGTIGFTAPFPIPEVIRHVNAYTLGARSVRADAQVKVVWVNSWFAPAEERAAAETLINEGADVIASGGDSPAPGEAAKAAGVPWTGYDSDQSENFPEIWLTAAVYDWGPYYIDRVQKALDGEWETGEYYGNIADGFTDIAPFGELVSEETRAAIEEKKKELIETPLSSFRGPIADQDGKERVAAGEIPPLSDLLTMDWFVEGVVGDPTG